MLALLSCGLFGLGAPRVLAQVQPDAGRVQEQLRVPTPAPTAKPPSIRIDPPPPGKVIDTPAFPVSGFRIADSIFEPIKSVRNIGVLPPTEN